MEIFKFIKTLQLKVFLKLKEINNFFKYIVKRSYLFLKNIEVNNDFDDLRLIDFEPVRGCNLRCRMCHVSFMKEKVKYMDLEGVDFSFCAGKVVTIGAVFEPFIHPKINDFIDSLNKVGARLIIITNGHNLNKKEIPALFESDLEMVTFSFDGISKDSYEEIRVGGNYNRTLENIEKFISHHKPRGAKFAVNYTVLKKNLNEIEEAPKFWADRGVDLLRFIGMVVRENDDYLLNNNLLNLQEEYSKVLRNSIETIKKYQLSISISNPRFREWFPEKCSDGIFNLKQGAGKQEFISVHHKYEFNDKSPIGNSCSSPFTTARIDYDSNVYLCHNQKIGNLKSASFADIWESKQATSLRKRLIVTNELCNKCDYFKLCINSHYLDTTAPENYFSNDFKDRFPDAYQEAIK
jgi:radical SAM protein with 4Fe4S-binding SPASM domain